jgi:hydroxymethylpyrimidine pyrophosphatase-like HAD family hydrolase
MPFTKNQCIDRAPNSLHPYNRRRVADLLSEIQTEPVKAMVIGEENVSSVIDEIQTRGLFGNFVFADAFSADILPEGVNKGVSLRSLADIQGVPLERAVSGTAERSGYVQRGWIQDRHGQLSR